MAADPLSELALQTKTTLLIRDRKANDAAQLLESALARNDRNPFVLNLLAQQAIDSRVNIADAIKYATIAREINPASESALHVLVRAFVLDDDPIKAMQLAMNVARATPELFTPRRLLAELQMDVGDFDGADRTIRGLEKDFPKNTYTLGHRIEWYRRQGRVGEAIHAGHQAVKQLPTAMSVRVRAAMACAAARRFREAHLLLDEAQTDDRFLTLYRVLLHVVEGNFTVAQTLVNEAMKMYESSYSFRALRAWLLANEGAFEEAHALVDDAMQEAPSDSLPHVVKLDVLVMQLRLADAAGLADQWLQRFSSSHDFNVTAAQAYLQNGRLQDALKRVQHVLTFDRSSTIAIQIKSMVLLELGKHREALDVAERGLAQFPRSTGLIAQRGYVHFRAFGEVSAAERDFMKAVHRNPGGLLARTCLGQIAYSRRDYRNAQERFRSVADAQPHSAAACTNLAWSYTASFTATGETTDLDQAEKACGRALEIDENHARAIGCLSAVAFHRRQRHRAEELLNDAVHKAPKDTELRVNLGGLQSRMGKYDDAEQTLRAALELQQDHPRCLIELSQLTAKLGRLSEARVFARRAIDADAASSEGWRAMAAAFAAEQNLVEAEKALRQALARVDDDESASIRLDLARILLTSASASLTDVRYRDALEHINVVIHRTNRSDAYVLKAVAQLKIGEYAEAQSTLSNVPDHRSTEPHVRSLQEIARSHIEAERRGVEPRLRTSMFALVMATIVGIFAFRALGQLNDTAFATLLPLLLAFSVIVIALPLLVSFKVVGAVEAQLAIPARDQRHELVTGPALDLDMPPTAQLVAGTLSFDN